MATDYELYRERRNRAQNQWLAEKRKDPAFVVAERAKWREISSERRKDPIFQAKQRAYRMIKLRRLQEGATFAEAKQAASAAAKRAGAKAARELQGG